VTHGVSGIDWKHYKHPLPENVFDVYMQYWKDKNTLGKLVEEKLSGMAVKSALTLHLRRGT
jgi:hypothetical protein